MRKWLLTVVATAVLGVSAASAFAQAQTFVINATGAQERPNAGDPDGTAVGTLTLNPGTGGTTGSATVNLVLANIEFPLTAYHIHTGAAGASGSPLINFGNPEMLRSGNTLSGTIPDLSTANINTVLANPAGYYLNIHNGPFGGGAVRDQLPEPGALGLLGIAALPLLRRRRRSAR